MKIIDKQTIRIPVILSFALVLFSVIVYLFFSYFRKQELTSYLQITAINRAKLIFEKNVNPKQFSDADRDLKESAYLQEQFTYYDSLGNVVYKSTNAIPHLTPNILKKVLSQKIILEKDEYERIFFAYRENKQSKLYIFEASAYDTAGFNKQTKLLYTLVFSTLILIALMAFSTRYFIRKDLKPLGNIAKRMKSISSKNLQNRIPEADLDNEIGNMAHTFNELLDRLDAAYTQQRNFVSYATHELRTPLAILLGNTQVTLMKTRNTEEYIETLNNFELDINNMINLMNSLLELARMNADSQSVPFTDVRVDDLLWQTSGIVKKKKPEYKINIEFADMPEYDEALIINGNAELMALVFRNLMENGCKYSPKQEVEVKILFDENNIILDFVDEGVGMSAKEMEHIYEAFYRTEKTKEISGHGIGLPLTKRIVEIHTGTITVKSVEGEGSTFRVSFPIKPLS